MPSSNSSNKPSPFSIPQGTRLSGGIDPRQFSRDYKEEKASQSLQNLQSVPLSDDHRRMLVKEHVGFKSDSMSYNPFAAFARTHPSESIRSQATFLQTQQEPLDRGTLKRNELQLEGRLHKERLQREVHARYLTEARQFGAQRVNFFRNAVPLPSPHHMEPVFFRDAMPPLSSSLEWRKQTEPNVRAVFPELHHRPRQQPRVATATEQNRRIDNALEDVLEHTNKSRTGLRGRLEQARALDFKELTEALHKHAGAMDSHGDSLDDHAEVIANRGKATESFKVSQDLHEGVNLKQFPMPSKSRFLPDFVRDTFDRVNDRLPDFMRRKRPVFATIPPEIPMSPVRSPFGAAAGAFGAAAGAFGRGAGAFGRGVGALNRGVGAIGRGVGAFGSRVGAYQRGIQRGAAFVGAFNRGVGGIDTLSHLRTVPGFSRGLEGLDLLDAYAADASEIEVPVLEAQHLIGGDLYKDYSDPMRGARLTTEDPVIFGFPAVDGEHPMHSELQLKAGEKLTRPAISRTGVSYRQEMKGTIKNRAKTESILEDLVLNFGMSPIEGAQFASGMLKAMGGGMVKKIHPEDTETIADLSATKTRLGQLAGLHRAGIDAMGVASNIGFLKQIRKSDDPFLEFNALFRQGFRGSNLAQLQSQLIGVSAQDIASGFKINRRDVTRDVLRFGEGNVQKGSEIRRQALSFNRGASQLLGSDFEGVGESILLIEAMNQSGGDRAGAQRILENMTPASMFRHLSKHVGTKTAKDILANRMTQEQIGGLFKKGMRDLKGDSPLGAIRPHEELSTRRQLGEKQLGNLERFYTADMQTAFSSKLANDEQTRGFMEKRLLDNIDGMDRLRTSVETLTIAIDNAVTTARDTLVAETERAGASPLAAMLVYLAAYHRIFGN